MYSMSYLKHMFYMCELIMIVHTHEQSSRPGFYGIKINFIIILLLH